MTPAGKPTSTREEGARPGKRHHSCGRQTGRGGETRVCVCVCVCLQEDGEQVLRCGGKKGCEVREATDSSVPPKQKSSGIRKKKKYQASSIFL